MGVHCHVVLGQKLRNFKGPVSRGIVVVDNEVLVLPVFFFSQLTSKLLFVSHHSVSKK